MYLIDDETNKRCEIKSAQFPKQSMVKYHCNISKTFPIRIYNLIPTFVPSIRWWLIGSILPSPIF